DSSFTYLVTPQLRLSDSLMTYVRLATGYQPGGPNTPGGPGENLPPVYLPSKTINYELGLKTRLFDRRLSLDTPTSYIDWKDIQLQAFTPPPVPFPYITNIGKARSQGVELEAEFKPVESLTVSTSAAFIDAILTSTSQYGFPGSVGQQLPFYAKFTGSMSAEQ